LNELTENRDDENDINTDVIFLFLYEHFPYHNNAPKISAFAEEIIPRFRDDKFQILF
jgi:hypothetical protein